MDYTKTNKAAWEEAFVHRKPEWGDDNADRIKDESLAMFDSDFKETLRAIDFTDKDIVQFCCNNGRELLSLIQQGARRGVGFDIAESILDQARMTAEAVGITNCEFVCADVLSLPHGYEQSFDYALLTIGATPWFRDLSELIKSVSDSLRKGGIVLINEFHPVFNMLPIQGDEEFDAKDLSRFAYPYFSDKAWVETGMDYMSDKYDAQEAFTSFSHTLSDIFTALISNGFSIKRFLEYDYDVGISDVYNNRGLPLSYTLIAQKQ
jgi:SAM-dependent methyltransferase